MVLLNYNIIMAADSCVGCFMPQRCTAKSTVASRCQSFALSKLHLYLSTPSIYQSPPRARSLIPISDMRRPEYETWTRKRRPEDGTLSFKYSFVSRSFTGYGYSQRYNIRSTERSQRVSASPSAEGANGESEEDDQRDVSSIRNPSDKVENNTDKPSSLETNDENLPSTSGRSTPSQSPPQQSWWRKPKWRWNFNWSWKGNPAVQAHEIGALLLQLSLVVLLMQLIRPGVPFPGRSKSSATAESSSTSYISVSFSEFLGKLKRNKVEKVEIDGVHFTYSLRRKAQFQREPQVSSSFPSNLSMDVMKRSDEMLHSEV